LILFQGVPLVRFCIAKTTRIFLDVFLLVISLRIGIPWDENHYEKPPFKGEYFVAHFFQTTKSKQIQAKNAMFPYHHIPQQI